MPSFYHPPGEVLKHRHWLPHWEQGEALYFVTWRLADSLPQSVLHAWKEERQQWLRRHPRPWDRRTSAEYRNRFASRMEDWLDRGRGSCLLRDPAHARIVADSLRHFDDTRYWLDAYVIMPNHVHVLFLPAPDHRLEEIVKSWKGFSARAINHRQGRTGPVWQEDYWDRLIRNEQHWSNCRAYIFDNPTRAGLREGEYLLGSPGDG